MRIATSCLVLFGALFCGAPYALGASPAEQQREKSMALFRKDIQPLLKRACFDCHGKQEQNGNLRLDVLNPDMAIGQDGETWHDALNKLNLGEMPPEDAPQLKSAEREMLVEWLNYKRQENVVIQKK